MNQKAVVPKGSCSDYKGKRERRGERIHKRSFCSSKLFGVLLFVLWCVGLGGCGKEEASDVSNFGIDGYVYQATYQELDIGANSNMSNHEIWNDYFYYMTTEYPSYIKTDNPDNSDNVDYFLSPTTTINFFSLLEVGETKTISLGSLENESFSSFTVKSNGNILALSSVFSMDGVSSFTMYEIDESGNFLFEQPLNEIIDEGVYLQDIYVDEQDRIYIPGDTSIYLFAADGSFHGKIETTDYVSTLGRAKDGKVYLYSYTNNGPGLMEVDFAAKKLGATYENYSFNGIGLLNEGVNADFLMNDGSSLCDYDLTTQTSTPILNWIDSDISASSISYFAVLSDGRVVVVMNYWDENSSWSELAWLKKTAVADIPEKEMINFGAFMSDQTLSEAIVAFNKRSDKYRIACKVYYQPSGNYSEEDYTNAMAAMNDDIASGKNMDLFSLDSLDVAEYAAKGAFEDLTPYLDASTVLSKEDFVESVLDAYTFDDVLITIPQTFYIEAFAGKKSILQERKSWTVDDILAIMDEYPDADLLSYASKDVILQVFLMTNADSFIDWKTGKCSFDTDEFVKYLEIANRFPAEYDYDQEMPSEAQRIADDSLLLMSGGFGDVDSYLAILAQFGGEPVSFIGYPTSDESSGVFLTSSGGGLYGILSKSKHKEAAWEFMEYLYSNSNNNNRYSWGFPSFKSALEKMFEEAMVPQYMTDENGEQVEMPISSIGYGNGERYEIYAAKEEDIENIRKLIDSAGSLSGGLMTNQDLFTIIAEETAPYFAGQKSAEEVAKIIQSRAQVYMDEKQ
ncbi:MAG: extracellular solute-binding protein [Lachnospiraceae bacterium]|nr:extracellular solute-binding protein [Lachnospiraceae bacterium]